MRTLKVVKSYSGSVLWEAWVGDHGGGEASLLQISFPRCYSYPRLSQQTYMVWYAILKYGRSSHTVSQDSTFIYVLSLPWLATCLWFLASLVLSGLPSLSPKPPAVSLLVEKGPQKKHLKSLNLSPFRVLCKPEALNLEIKHLN